jgi:tetratricopeptide (TPR) repeat protein
MRTVSIFIVCVCATVLAFAQTPPAPPPTAVVTNQAATTNDAAADLVKHLTERIDGLEAKSKKDDLEVDRLQTQLVTADARVDRIREAEDASRNTLFSVLYSVIALAAISVIGLVAFCFYTLRRLTQLGEPIFDNFHKPHYSALPYGAHAGMLPHQTVPPQYQEQATTAVAHAGETRLLDAVDRLEKKIEEMEKIAHHENNHLTASIHQPAVVPQPPFVNGAPSQSIATPEVDGNRNFRQADRLVLLMNKGEAHTNLGQFDRAVECFEQAILLAPTDPSPVVKKGYAFEKAGKLEEAVQCYDQALNLDPNFSMAYLFKGGVCNRLQRYSEAIDCYDRALAVRSNQPS